MNLLCPLALEFVTVCDHLVGKRRMCVGRVRVSRAARARTGDVVQIRARAWPVTVVSAPRASATPCKLHTIRYIAFYLSLGIITYL